jgi:hypothetical protein
MRAEKGRGSRPLLTILPLPVKVIAGLVCKVEVVVRLVLRRTELKANRATERREKEKKDIYLEREGEREREMPIACGEGGGGGTFVEAFVPYTEDGKGGGSLVTASRSPPPVAISSSIRAQTRASTDTVLAAAPVSASH